MAATFAAALVIGVISACVGSIYYCRQPHESRDSRRDDEESEEESPFVRIKISHPHRERILQDGTCTDLEETPRDSTDPRANGKSEGKACTFGEKHVQVHPVKPPRSCRRRTSQVPAGTCAHQNDRSSKGIWSSAMQTRLENITNSEASTSYCDAVRLVRAQVEVYPRNTLSSNNESPDKTQQLAAPATTKTNSSVAASNESRIPGKRHHSVVKKWKHLKKSIMCSRLIKSISIKEVRPNEVVEEDATRRSNITARASLRQSPVGHSTMLRKNRLVDASTSTKLSARTDSRREICATDRAMSHGQAVSREVVDPKDNSRPNTEVLEDVVSLIKRRSADGKSLCDVRITGLSMNQAELLGLFEATGGQSKSASIVTTEEASIISIKFQRDRRGDRSNDESTNSPEESPLRSIFKLIPDKLTDITFARWFRSDKSEPKITRVPKHLFLSANETSYLGMPRERPENSLDSPFARGRFAEASLARLVEERKR